MILIELYDYQKAMIENLSKAWHEGYKRPCIVLPCGGGKSVIASEIAKRTTDNNKEVMFLVHRQELCEQIENSFRNYGVNMNLCTVNMVQTASRHTDKFNPSLIITDENHHCVANTYRKIYNAFPSAYSVGLTATPCRLNGGGLGEINDKLIIGVTAKWLIANNRLAPYRYYAPQLADMSGLKMRAGDYSQEEAAELLNKPQIYGDVINYYKELADGQKAVCYCPTIAYSQMIANAFNLADIPAKHIDGSTPKDIRKQIVSDFRQGKIKILCNVDLISEGFDVPDCSVSILLRPTKSLNLYIQQSMRCMRYQPNKTATIIDHVGNVHRHGLPDADRQWTLEPKPESKRTSGGVKVKQCPECFFTHNPAPACPNCGYVYIPTKEELKEQREAKLIEISKVSLADADLKSWDDIRDFQQAHKFKFAWCLHYAERNGIQIPSQYSYMARRFL